MDPEMALELVKHGATFLLLDVPQYTLVGIDTQVPCLAARKIRENETICENHFLSPSVLQVFTVGPAFKGVKMIPSGPHFVFYSSSSRFSLCLSLS